MTPERLATIHAACFAQRPWSAREISELLAKPTTRLTSSPCQNGFALTQLVAGEAELLMIAVLPTAQGKGLGTVLLEGLLSTLARENAERLFLDVAEDNTAARALYKAFDFNQVGLRKGYYARRGAAPACALVLCREIAS